MMGTKKFVALCKGLEKKYGERFKPNKLLLDMAAKGESFYTRFAPKRQKAGGVVSEPALRPGILLGDARRDQGGRPASTAERAAMRLTRHLQSKRGCGDRRGQGGASRRCGARGSWCRIKLETVMRRSDVADWERDGVPFHLRGRCRC